MTRGKQLVYIYDFNDEHPEDIDINDDLTDELPIPKQGSTMRLNWRLWNIVSVVEVETPPDKPRVIKVYLCTP